MSAPDAVTRSNRVKLVLLVALFLLPPIAAWVAWQVLSGSGAAVTTNSGTLVSPARPLTYAGLVRVDGGDLDAASLRGRWTYVMFAGEACDARCREWLYLTRQIRLGVNKDIPRVQRLLVFMSAPAASVVKELSREHEDLVWAVAGAEAAPLLAEFKGDGYAPDGEQFFLVDPLGNLMMFYGQQVPPGGVIKDLRKLLKISQIG